MPIGFSHINNQQVATLKGTDTALVFLLEILQIVSNR